MSFPLIRSGNRRRRTNITGPLRLCGVTRRAIAKLNATLAGNRLQFQNPFTTGHLMTLASCHRKSLDTEHQICLDVGGAQSDNYGGMAVDRAIRGAVNSCSE